MYRWLYNDAASGSPMILSKGELDLNNLFRLLWEQHVAWTRMTIISIVFGLPDEKATIDRLLRNPVDIGEAFKMFYGRDIGTKIRTLFTEHLVLAAELVKAAKAGNNAAAADIEKRWYANADAIATLLASINPYWAFAEWQKMLHEHLRLVKAQAVKMLGKDYAGSIAIYDQYEIQALQMADTMSSGIARQFQYVIYYP